MGDSILLSYMKVTFLALLVVFGCYFLPTIIALGRRVRHQGSVVVVNLFLGWTLIGWVVALAMACRTNST